MKQSKAFTRLLSVYLEQLKGNDKEVETMLLEHQPDLEQDSFFTISTWIWLLQKQLLLQPNHPPLLTIDYIPYTDYLCEQWSKPNASIWGEDRRDIYLSNIAMAYAALLETKNVRNHFSVQQTMTDIRDYVFSHLLSGGSVLNGTNERSLAVDQLLAVMPYGLFSPEDLIVVEAVQRMSLQLAHEEGLLPFVEAREPSPAAAALFALYYLEKSDREKAIYYAQMARKDLDHEEFATVIMGIYDFFAHEGVGENKIVHLPNGYGNVYIPQLTERIPLSPALDEYLQLTCQVMSEETIESVIVKLANKSNTWEHEAVLKPIVKNNTLVYETKLAPLPYHESYQYSFTATLSCGTQVVSEEYEVSTLKKHSTEQFYFLNQTENELTLAFGDGEGVHGLSFSFREAGLDIQLKQNISVATETAASQTALLQSGEYSLQVQLDQAIIELYKGNRRVLATHPLYSAIEWKSDIAQQVKEFLIHWHSPESEQFYGFGERYNAMEQRGEVIDCFVYNQYRDQGTRTYMPIPFYLTNTGYGCFIETNLYTKFDLASELKDKCTVTIEQVPYIAETMIHLYLGEYKENIQSFTNDTGKPKMIPVWALGPWMSSNNWDRESIVRQEVETTNHYQIPSTVIVLEQWSDEATYYMFNDAEYNLKEPSEHHRYEEMVFPQWGRWPNPKEMVNYLHENGLKLILWQIPIQKYLNKQKHPLKDLDEAYMIEKGYVVKNEDGSPYRIPESWFTNSLIMDFSHKEGCEWWFNKRQYLIDIGVDGFKTDGGEFVFGKNLQFANGQTGSEMRNQYPNDYIAAYYDFAQQNNGITFSRSGYTGAQNFPAHWAGDERSTFAAFKRSLIAGLNAGLAGIPFWGWDLAGFNGDIPSAELFMRSSAMAAFCPIMQYHAESKAEFNQDRTPWNIAERTGTEEVIDVYRFFANVRMNILPYIYQESQKASESGLPMMRALMVDFPEDNRLRGLYDEYLFGECLLVAPIIEEGAITRKIYLPEGTWFNLWTNEKVRGPVHTTAAAQVNQIPVYVKENTAMLVNVDDSRQLGSGVGNDITAYQTPVCKIYYTSDFEQTLTDHLGNHTSVSVTEDDDVLILNVASDIDNLQWEVAGCSKPVRISRQ